MLGNILQTEMMTRAELAFSGRYYCLHGLTGSFLTNFSYQALDKDNSGFISAREMRKLSAKLSEGELKALMVKVRKFLRFCGLRTFSIFLVGF